MTSSSSSEYHVSVRHSIPAAVAFPILLVLSPVFVSTSLAQINGAPASVTSPGFGGRAVNGTPASVTSLGPNGFAPNSRVTFSTSTSASTHPRTGDGHHRRHHVEYIPPLVYALPVPYAVDIGATDADTDTDNDTNNDASASREDRDPNYQGGPTIFDRRGSGAASYMPPVETVPKPHASQDAASSATDPEPPQAQTLLAFKDGRKLELGNYAIIGTTLFDLTPGHARRVALTDLDLEATRKLNDDRGITFQLPPPTQAN